MHRLKLLEERADLEESLIEFFRGAWPSFDPAPYADNWHLEAIAEHLQAVTDGEIRRLLINVPPRSGKTALVSIAWPAWTWAQSETGMCAGPQVKFLCLSYASPLSLEIATTARRLVDSAWYQERWSDRVKVTKDQASKSKFDTTAGGSRIASSFGGSTLGRGGDIRIVDDPHKVDEAESDKTRDSVIKEYDEALATRITDPKSAAEVVIMQRLSDRDLSGHILAANDAELVHLCLPMRFDSSRRCVTVLGWEDPRQEDGELLWPGRFDEESVARWEARLGPYATAGQLGQAPVPRGGGIIKEAWWQLYAEIKHPAYEFILGSLDTNLGGEADDDSYSALTLWGIFQRDGKRCIMLVFAWRGRPDLNATPTSKDEMRRLGITDATPKLDREKIFEKAGRLGLVEKVASVCERYRVDRLLIENKARGKDVANEMRRQFELASWQTEMVDPTGQGDKMARLEMTVPMFTQGLIHAPGILVGEEYRFRDWAQMAIDEICTAPRAAFDDITDTASAALRHIRTRNLVRLPIEEKAIEEAAMKKRRRAKPLYPV